MRRLAAFNRALDGGINFIDSSAAYRWSEELIARYAAHRRHEFIFATKCGSDLRAPGRRRVGADPRLLGG